MRIPLRLKFSLYSVLLVLVTVLGLYFAAFRLTRHYLIIDIGERMEVIAATAALQVDGDLHEQVRSMDDVSTDAFGQVVAQLKKVRAGAGVAEELYTFRPQGDQLAFVAMTHESPFVGDTYDYSKFNLDGPIERVLKTGQAQHTSLYRSSGDDYISGLGAIKNGAGDVVGILFVDFRQASFDKILFERLGLLLKASLGILLGAVLISLFAIRAISGPIRRTILAIDQISASKDLTTRIDSVSQDELGQLADSFNLFTQEIQGLIRQVLEAAGQMIHASHDVAGKGRDMEALAERMKGRAADVDAQSRQTGLLIAEIVDTAHRSSSQAGQVLEANSRIGENMLSVDTSARQLRDDFKSLADAVGQVSHTIQDVRTAVDETSAISHEAARVTDETNENVAALQEAAKQIGNVVDVIGKVAEKTNLLALNASIEAAHAGDAGKGFAVVANEILELAQQTSESTKDIRDRISKMQERTEATTGAIVQITQIIGTIDSKTSEVADAVEVQTQSVLEIESRMDGANQLALEVSTAVEEATALSREVVELAEQAGAGANVILEKSQTVKSASVEVEKHSEAVSENSMTTAEHASSLGASGEALSELAETLRERIDVFKVE